MPAQTPTPELRREVQAMRLHGVLDPKRFLRGEAKRERNKLPEFFQVRCLDLCYCLCTSSRALRRRARCA